MREQRFVHTDTLSHEELEYQEGNRKIISEATKRFT